MKTTGTPWKDLIDGVSSAEPERRNASATEMLARFEGFARRVIKPWLTDAIDPKSVALSVYRRFMANSKLKSSPADPTSQSDQWLAAFFYQMAFRTVSERGKKAGGQSGDVRRPVALGGSTEPGDRSATPDQTAADADFLQKLLGGLTTEQQTALGLRLEGYTVKEIAEQLKVSEPTIRRYLNAIPQRSARLLGGEVK